MSGLAGIFNLDGRPVSAEVLAKMSARLARRGPHGGEIWNEGPAGIVRRLGAAEGGGNDDGCGQRSAVIALDGWVDNREELAAELGIAEDPSDAEVLAGAFATWGEDCFAHILGDFAAVIFEKEQSRLFCARDPFAMKPLYYWHNGATLVFASDIPTLLVHQDIAREPNEETVAELLNWFGHSRTNTLFKDVYRLAPGHVLSASRSGVKIRPFWTGAGISETRLGSDAEYGEAFREVVGRAVRDRVRRFRRVGVRLSGGLDSSTILALAAESGARGLHAYSIAGPDVGGDESYFIDAALRHCNVTGTKVGAAQISAEDLLATAAEYLDLPDYPSGAQGDSLKAAVQADGVNLLLTGVGGDDWFFGSALEYADLIRRLDFRGLVGAYRRNGDLGEIVGNGIAPLVPAHLRRLMNRAAGRHRAAPWIHAGLASRVDLYGKSQLRWDVRGYSGYAQLDTLRRATNPLETHLMEMEERSQWRFGFAQRHPFFDRRVAEFALSLPQEQKQRQPGKYKYIIRHAMQGRLPKEVLTRVDSPGGVPTIRQKLLDPVIARMFERLKIADRSWIAGNVVEQMYANLRKGGDVPPVHVLALWRIVGVEAWARVALS